MPYGEGPKSGCRCRTGVLFVAVRPLIQSTSCADRESTGAPLISAFHQLDDGNTCRPVSASLMAGGVAAYKVVSAQRMVTTSGAGRGTFRMLHVPCRSSRGTASMFARV